MWTPPAPCATCWCPQCACRPPSLLLATCGPSQNSALGVELLERATHNAIGQEAMRYEVSTASSLRCEVRAS